MAEHWFSKDPKEQLAGKTAIIMGGGSGIGKATAELFAAAGANLMITGVPEQICLDTAAAPTLSACCAMVPSPSRSRR